MGLYMSTLGTLVPERPCYVFYETRHQVYWGPTHSVVICLYSDLILQNTHTHKDTQHNQRPIDWHSHINIY